MQTATWKKIEQIFNEAVVLPRESQMAFVDERSGDEPKVRENVLRLLANDKQENFFLDEPLFTLGSRLMIENEDEDLTQKEMFAGYRLLQVIGRGGMGVVYLAFDARLNRRIALKLLPASIDQRADSVARFRQEARAASKVIHQNVTHIYDFGEYENRCFLAMEYVPGRTLRELLKEKQVEPEQAIDITLQIAAALAAAHRAGVLHRDIKPENIVVSDDGQIKVLDFGLAKISPAKKRENLETSLETVPGLIMGTTAYMSPEQIRGQPSTEATDLWSLGIILYEMLAGGRPFCGDTPGDIQAAILKDKPPLQHSLLPRELNTILGKLLIKNAVERCGSAQELIRELKEVKLRSLMFILPEPDHPLQTNPNHRRSPSENSRRFFFPTKGIDDRQIEITGKRSKSVIFALSGLLTVILALGAIYFFPVASSSDEIVSGNAPLKTIASNGGGVSQIAEADREYQRGIHIWNKRKVEDMPKALAHFQKAIELDPGFAPAYVGLANAYQWSGNPNLTRDERYSHVKASLQRALAIDPNSAEAHATLAFTLGEERDWHGAEREYRRALEINPNYAQAHHWYAEFLAGVAGRDEEAVAHIKRAREIDPLSFAILNDSVLIYYLAGRYDEAIANAEKIIAFDRRYERDARSLLARIYPKKGDVGQAKKEFRRYEELSDGKITDDERAYYLALFGEGEKALSYLKKAEKSPDIVSSSWRIARTYSNLNMKEEAFKWLEFAVANHSPAITFMAAEPDLDGLHSDPRFVNLLEQINMAEFWKDKSYSSK